MNSGSFLATRSAFMKSWLSFLATFPISLEQSRLYIVTYSTYTTSIYTCISPSSPVHGGEFHKRKQLNIYTKYISNDNVSFACTSASFTYDYTRPVTLVNVTWRSRQFWNPKYHTTKDQRTTTYKTPTNRRTNREGINQKEKKEEIKYNPKWLPQHTRG